MEQLFNLLQLTGGLILIIGYIPQILQMIRTKSVKDLNLKTYLATLIGILCMECYAVYLVLAHNSGQMFLVTNSASTLLASICVVLIIRYRKNARIA